MTKPDYLDQLMDQASTAAGSDYKLAKMLETTPQTVSNWRHGHKACPVADVVLMAEIAGLNSEEWAARAIVSKYQGTSKGDKLYRALGKALAATGVAIASSGVAAHQIFSHKGGAVLDAVQTLLNTMYRSVKFWKALPHMHPVLSTK